MARRLNVTDGYAVINAMVDEMIGANATITATDVSSFVSVGETLLNSGVENVLNTLSLVVSRDLIAIRPYQAKFRLINALDSGMYSNRIRKISYYAKYALPTGASNTNLYTNLAMGFDNGVNPDSQTPPVNQSTESMWLQNTPVPLELNFGGSTEWQYSYTIYENALKGAFRSPEDWTNFLNGFLVACANDVEEEKEAFSRMAVLNMIAGTLDMSSDMPESVVNMTTVCNNEWGTSYTTAQILESHFAEMLGVFVSTVKTISDMLENRSILYHWSPAKTINGVSYVLPRQTKKEDQRMFMISKFWNRAEATVLPAIFNDQYLKLENFQKVDYWQNINDKYAISVTPAIPDVNDPTEQIAGSAVVASVVLGVLFDRDACMVDFRLDDISVTPKESRKHFRNTWLTVNKNIINDFTENIVVFIMAD